MKLTASPMVRPTRNGRVRASSRVHTFGSDPLPGGLDWSASDSDV
jgi:hypothetical protein